MESDTCWPFVGRATQLDTIRKALETTTPAVVVAGPAGVGKTRLLTEITTGLRERACVAWVRANAAAREVPFGAFAHLLPADLGGTAAGNILRRAAMAVTGNRSGAPLLLAVDDAHALDSSSAALVHHLVMRRSVRLVASVRSGERAPDAVVSLWKDELALRVELAPLSLPECQHILDRALGGQVATGTVRRLWRITEGNALFLRELVLAGRSAGWLAESDGVWRWHGRIQVGNRLCELIEARVDGIPADVRAVLDLVALGEPLGLEPLCRLVSRDAVARAESARLVVLEQDGCGLDVRLAHPLYGEVIRAGLGVLSARQLYAALADAVESAGPPRAEDLLRLAQWRLDSGGPADPAALAAGCRIAWAAHDMERALRLGRAAVAAGAGQQAIADLGMVLYFAGLHDEAERSLGRPLPEHGDDRGRALHAIARAFNLNWGLGRCADAHRVLDDAVAAISDPAWRQAVVTQQASFHFYGARFDDAESLIARIRHEGPRGHRVSVHLAAIQAMVDGHSGRTGHARDTARAALDTVDAWAHEMPNVVLTLLHAATVAALFDGDLADADELITGAQRLVGEYGTVTVAVSTFAALRAQSCRLRGQVQDAARWAREAVAIARGRPATFSDLCLGELAHAMALTGEPGSARDCLTQAASTSRDALRVCRFPAELARTWVLAVRGERAAAVRNALSVASMADDLRLRGYQVSALHDVVRLGEPATAAEPLARLAERVHGDLAALCARHAAAGAARDGPALDRVAADFDRLGMRLLAAEAAAQAADTHQRAGRGRATQASQVAAATYLQHCQGAHTPALDALRAPALTARQREIARFAAQGMTTREIAERLVISTRTTSNHLYAIYQRLGVSGRSDLARRLRDL